MDIATIVADELRAMLRQKNRTVSPVALTQVGEAFKAVRAALGSDVLYQEFVTRVTTRLAGTDVPQHDRAWQTRADNHMRALFPEYFEESKPKPERPFISEKHRKFVL